MPYAMPPVINKCNYEVTKQRAAIYTKIFFGIPERLTCKPFIPSSSSNKDAYNLKQVQGNSTNPPVGTRLPVASRFLYLNAYHDQCGNKYKNNNWHEKFPD